MSLLLKDYRVSSLTIKNFRSLEGEHTMQFSFHHEIAEIEPKKYASKCSGKLSIKSELAPSEVDFFGVTMEIIGTFLCENDSDVTDSLDSECAKEMLPLLRTHIATAMSSIGMPAIIIPVYNFNVS